jgi:hypothetical protein
VPVSRNREKNPAPGTVGARQNTENATQRARKEPEMTESDGWQRIGEIPVDTARIVLVDPTNIEDLVDHEVIVDRETDVSMTYELVTSKHGIAVALVLTTGLGDGLYPVESRFEEVEGAMRIAEIRVRFLPHPVLGYELPR